MYINFFLRNLTLKRFTEISNKLKLFILKVYWNEFRNEIHNYVSYPPNSNR